MHHHFIARRGVSTVILIGLCAASTYANHGPGTSGGGLFTIPGETLKASAWDMSFRLDYTSFDGVSAAQAEARAAASGGFDSIDSSTLTNFALSYGVTDDLQVSAAVGWYWGNNFIDAEDTGKGIESATADPSGLTDLWITAKYRVMKGENGHLSILAGLQARARTTSSVASVTRAFLLRTSRLTPACPTRFAPRPTISRLAIASTRVPRLLGGSPMRSTLSQTSVCSARWLSHRS